MISISEQLAVPLSSIDYVIFSQLRREYAKWHPTASNSRNLLIHLNVQIIFSSTAVKYQLRNKLWQIPNTELASWHLIVNLNWTNCVCKSRRFIQKRTFSIAEYVNSTSHANLKRKMLYKEWEKYTIWPNRQWRITACPQAILLIIP